jgi:hypothetical protein
MTPLSVSRDELMLHPSGCWNLTGRSDGPSGPHLKNMSPLQFPFTGQGLQQRPRLLGPSHCWVEMLRELMQRRGGAGRGGAGKMLQCCYEAHPSTTTIWVSQRKARAATHDSQAHTSTHR